MDEFVRKIGISIEFSPAYSPRCNGIKRNHYSTDVIVRKTMQEDRGLSLQLAVDMAIWTHDTNVIGREFTPLQLMTGKSLTFLGIGSGNEAIQSMFEDEGVRNIIE